MNARRLAIAFGQAILTTAVGIAVFVMTNAALDALPVWAAITSFTLLAIGWLTLVFYGP